MRVIVLVFCLAFASVAGAAPADERALFRDLMASARAGELGLDSARLDALRGYPLYDYVIAADLKYRARFEPGASLDDRIERFIKGNPDLPPAERLRRFWLGTLAERGQWQTLLDNTAASDGTSAQCRAAHARIELGAMPREDALALWRVGESQPDSCDPVFAWLDKQGLLTPDEIMRRARLSLLGGQYGLVRYLGNKLPANLPAITDQWLGVAETPANLQYSRGLDADVAVYAFKRLALRDLASAADLLPELAERLSVDAGQRHEMQRYVALLYAQSQQPEALVWFARLDDTRMDDHARGWEVRAAIYHQRWPLVIEAIRTLPPEQASDEEWRYWLGRALTETGADDQAREILAPLAGNRSYHGYLAADQLDRDYSFNEQPLPPQPQTRARVMALPALARARELRALGQDYESRLEWNRVIDDLDAPGLQEAARIAAEWAWYSRAIITLARGDYWDDLDIRYPTPYLDAVEKAAETNDLSPAYVLAIMRTESLFQAEVRSPAGAIGLMQLMPGTADMMARDLGMAAPSSSALRLPAVNIPLGSRYLRNMHDRYGDNIALATASYNAGPGATERWLPAEPLNAAIWIANIPYTETRGYVQSVMSHMTVFQHRLSGEVAPLDERIAPVEPSYSAG